MTYACICCRLITAAPLNFRLGRVLLACLIAPIKVSWAQHHRLVSKRGCNSFKGAIYFYGAHESLLVPLTVKMSAFKNRLVSVGLSYDYADLSVYDVYLTC